jgi:hypothetical protein
MLERQRCGVRSKVDQLMDLAFNKGTKVVSLIAEEASMLVEG